MRPTPLALTDFELAILRHLATKLPALAEVIPRLRVLSREFSGNGSYTDFECPDVIVGATKPIGLSEAIRMPGVAFGMDGILFFKDGRPHCLEIVAFGGESWNGCYDGFCIPPAA